jgi:hypothetical protein
MTDEGFYENPFLNDRYWVICNEDHTAFMLVVEEVDDGDDITRVVFFEEQKDAFNYAKRASSHVPPGGRVEALTSEECEYILNLHRAQHKIWGVIFLANGETLHLDFKSYLTKSTGPGGSYNTIEA